MIPDDYLNDLKSRLAYTAEDVCRHLLGGGKRKGRRWICGGVDGGAGQSMNVELDGDKAGLWRDAATGEGGDLLTLWQTNQGLSFPEAVATAASFAGMLPPDTRETAPKLTHLSPASYTFEEPEAPKPAIEPLPPHNPNATQPRASTSSDWEKAVANFSDEHAAKLCEWRGFSPDFVKWLHRQELIGVHNGCFAFPVHDAKGNVTRIHYRLEKGWAYHPKGGGESAPLVIGNPIHATHTLAFESQWDALAILDKLDAHNPENEGIYAAYITRGATSNTNLSKLAVRHLIAFPQNDPPEKKSKTTGRTPAEEWLHKLQTTRHPVTEFAVFATPAPHKDANDWIREEKPDQFHVFKHAVEGARNPILGKIITIEDLNKYPVKDDPDSLIGYEDRFLGKGGSWLWIAPSGVGKSTLLADFAFHAATGVEWHGIKFRHPMKTLVIQAENDVGDMAEMMRGVFSGNPLLRKEDNVKLIRRNYLSHQESERVGKRFTQWLEEIIRETKVELVCIDPVLSYVGDDISLQKVSAQFFREWLQPVLIRTGVIALLLHHTGKPVKDGGKGTKGWNESDFSYMGLGSSDMVNWARAVSVIIPTKQEGIFLFKHSKRGKRSGMIDKSTGMKTKEIYLRHGNPNEGLAWFQCDYDDSEDTEETPPKRGRSGEGAAKSKELPTVEALMEFVPETSGILFNELCKKVRKAFGLSNFQSKSVVNKLRLSKHIVNDGSSWYVKRA